MSFVSGMVMGICRHLRPSSGRENIQSYNLFNPLTTWWMKLGGMPALSYREISFLIWLIHDQTWKKRIGSEKSVPMYMPFSGGLSQKPQCLSLAICISQTIRPMPSKGMGLIPYPAVFNLRGCRVQSSALVNSLGSFSRVVSSRPFLLRTFHWNSLVSPPAAIKLYPCPLLSLGNRGTSHISLYIGKGFV